MSDVYEITIGDKTFSDLAEDSTRYAMAGLMGVPRRRWQKSTASGYQGQIHYDHGFSHLPLTIMVAYVGENCEADMNSDMALWDAEEVDITIDQVNYEKCRLAETDPQVERYPKLYIVTYFFEKSVLNA